MAAENLPVFTGVVRTQRRSLLLWGLALAAVSSLYVGLYPSMGANGEMQALVDQLPQTMVTAFGYDQLGSAGGWISSTVYGLIAPVLLLVFGISTGARLIAGQEEDGSLELELASPLSRGQLFAERLAALWFEVVGLVVVVMLVTYALVVGLDMEVPVGNVLAGSVGLALLDIGIATLAFAVGAATGRRSAALAVAAALAVVSFVFDALGPSVAEWMTTVSPFSWYLAPSPLVHGLDPRRVVLLAVIPVVAATAGAAAFVRRDLMV